MDSQFKVVSSELIELLFRSLNGGDSQLSGMEHGRAFRELKAIKEAPASPQADVQRELERCYEHALTAMEGEADRLRAQLKRDSAEAAQLQSYLVGTARTIRPVDGSGLYAWALAALQAHAVQS